MDSNKVHGGTWSKTVFLLYFWCHPAPERMKQTPRGQLVIMLTPDVSFSTAYVNHTCPSSNCLTLNCFFSTQPFWKCLTEVSVKSHHATCMSRNTLVHQSYMNTSWGKHGTGAESYKHTDLVRAFYNGVKLENCVFILPGLSAIII